MRPYRVIPLLICAFLVLLSTNAWCQNMILRGKVVWNSGAPAIGLEIQLRQNNRLLATTFTNESGRYAFFNINQSLHEFMVVVSDRKQILKQVQQITYPSDGIIPDITI